MLQSQTADKPTAPQGSTTQQSRDTWKTIFGVKTSRFYHLLSSFNLIDVITVRYIYVNH